MRKNKLNKSLALASAVFTMAMTSVVSVFADTQEATPSAGTTDERLAKLQALQGDKLIVGDTVVDPKNMSATDITVAGSSSYKYHKAEVGTYYDVNVATATKVSEADILGGINSSWYANENIPTYTGETDYIVGLGYTSPTFGTFTDVDADILTYTASDDFAGGDVAVSSNGTISFPTGLGVGTYNFTVTATDTSYLQLKQNFTLKVVEDATKPVVTGLDVQNITSNGAKVLFTSSVDGNYSYTFTGTTTSAVTVTPVTGTGSAYSAENVFNTAKLQAGIDYTLSLKVTNTSGIASDEVTKTFTTSSDLSLITNDDVTGPVLSAPVVVSNETGNSASLKFTSDEAGKYSYTITPVVNGLTQTDITMNASENVINLSGLSEKVSYTVVVQGEDQYGNTSNRITFATFTTPDKTAPVVTTSTAVTVTNTTATLVFNTTEAGTYSYIINGGSAAKTGTATVNSNSILVENLTKNTNYTIELFVTDAASNKSNVVTYTFTTANRDEDAPIVTNNGVSNLTKNSATLSLSSNEAGTYSYDLGDGVNKATDVAITAGQTVTINLSQLQEKVKYDVVVTVKDQSQYSDDSTTTFSFTTPDQTAPVVTTSAAVVVTDTQATVKFNSDEAGTYSYKVNGGTAVTGSAINGENTIIIKNLTPDTNYTVEIFVTDAVTLKSNVVYYTFKTEVADVVAPVLTNPVVVDKTGTTAQLSFTTSEAGTITYTIDSGSAVTYGEATVGTNTVNLTGLTTGKTYTVDVYVTDASTNKSTGLRFAVTTLDAATITNLTVPTTTKNSANVEFNVNTTGSYTYKVTKKGETTAVATGSSTTITDATPKVTFTVNSGLVASTDYTVTVNFVGAKNTGAPSANVDFRTTDEPIVTAQITSLTIQSTTSNSAVAVIKTNVDGTYNYELQCTSGSAVTVTNTDNTSVTGDLAKNISLTSLEENAEYKLIVTFTGNQVGSGNDTAEVTFTAKVDTQGQMYIVIMNVNNQGAYSGNRTNKINT